MKLPKTWGWFGFSMAITGIVGYAVWGLGRVFDWISSGDGGRILFVTIFVMLPIGIALFGSSEAWDAFRGKDEED